MERSSSPTSESGVHPLRGSMPAPARARLEALFNDHHDFIWRLLRRLGLSPDRADDAAQQVFMVAAERLEVIRSGSERSFLFGAALRIAKATHRNVRRLSLEEDLEERLPGPRTPEELVEQQRAVALLDRTLDRLELDLRTVFVLFELEGMTTPEIAAMIGIPLGTAASRLRRAREAFRAALAEQAPNQERQGKEEKS